MASAAPNCAAAPSGGCAALELAPRLARPNFRSVNYFSSVAEIREPEERGAVVDVRLQLDEGPIRVALSVVDHPTSQHTPAMFSLFNKRSEERLEASAALAVQAAVRGNAARKKTRQEQEVLRVIQARARMRRPACAKRHGKPHERRRE